MAPYIQQDRIALARYSHLPVGNTGSDWMLHSADVLFARCLRDAGHLLWATDPHLPDVAGRDAEGAAADELLDPEQDTMEV